MQVVVLNATHNKQGMTNLLANAFSETIRERFKEAKIMNFDLLNEDIKFCTGCTKCTSLKAEINAECIIKDKCEKIKKEALECDILVFVTPIYEYAVSSSMKRFLERCLTLVTFKFGPAPKAKPIKAKHGVVICCSGAPFPINHLMGFTRYPKKILRLACKLFRCANIHEIYAGGMRGSNRMQQKYVEKTKKLAEKIADKY